MAFRLHPKSDNHLRCQIAGCPAGNILAGCRIGYTGQNRMPFRSVRARVAEQRRTFSRPDRGNLQQFCRGFPKDRQSGFLPFQVGQPENFGDPLFFR